MAATIISAILNPIDWNRRFQLNVRFSSRLFCIPETSPLSWNEKLPLPDHKFVKFTSHE